MTKYNDAWKLVGGLSTPSKMPCYSYSIPASSCKMGNILAKADPNSICGKCYAKRGHYMYGHVQKTLENRLKSLYKKGWVQAMTFLIKSNSMMYFRWHDSGDIQSMKHFKNIIQVCLNTPETKHWLPTREFNVVKEYVEKGGKIPDNLIVRFSAVNFDAKPPIGMAKHVGVQVSGASKLDYNCPASKQGNECGLCRMCWDKNTFEVTYKRH